MQPKLSDWEAKKFQLILVTSDQADDLKAFFAKHPLPIKTLLDPSGQVSQQYQVQYIPSDFLINEKGVIDSSFVGWDNNRSNEMEKWLSK